MINYNVIVRNLTEWTGTGQQGVLDQSSIANGIGGVTFGAAQGYASAALTPTVPAFGYCNVRQFYIQGIDSSTSTATSGTATTLFTAATGMGNVPNGVNTVSTTNSGGVATGGSGTNAVGYCSRRYQVNFALGLFTQDKLIPTKFMASQLAVELTLETAEACMLVLSGTGSGAAPTYLVGNINLIPEILEFDASYDAMFLRGLREGGVPLKFSSWHTFIFTVGGSANVNLLVQERSRSVKALFAVQRRAPTNRSTDSHACFFDTAATVNTMQNYQYRIGGR